MGFLNSKAVVPPAKSSRYQRDQDEREAVATEHYTYLMRRVTKTRASPPKVSTQKIELTIRNAMQQVTVLVDMVDIKLKGELFVNRVISRKELRRFCEDRGIERPPKSINRINTAMFILSAWFVELFFAGSTLVSDGKMGVIEGYSYAASFSALNIAAGVAIGYWTLRFFNLKRHDSMPTARVRLMARTGFFAGIAGLGLLIYSAARGRVTDDLFSFNEASFVSTFNDPMTLIIFAIGILGSAVAIGKGFHGIDDPIPQYSEYFERCEILANAPAEELVEQVQDRIEVLYDDVLAAHQDYIDDQKDFHDYQRTVKDIERRLHDHELEITLLETDSKRRAEKDGYVEFENSTIRTDYSDLRIPIKETLKTLEIKPPEDNTAELLAQLDTIVQNSTIDLNAALLAFYNSDSRLPSDFTYDPDTPNFTTSKSDLNGSSELLPTHH